MKKDKVYDFGLKLFRGVVVRQPSVRPRLRRLLLDSVRRERCGEVIDKSLMKNTLGMLVELGVAAAQQAPHGEQDKGRSSGGSSRHRSQHSHHSKPGSGKPASRRAHGGSSGGQAASGGSTAPVAATAPTVYEEEFETPFLEETKLFYKEEAQRFIAENTCPVYLLKVPTSPRCPPPSPPARSA